MVRAAALPTERPTAISVTVAGLKRPPTPRVTSVNLPVSCAVRLRSGAVRSTLRISNPDGSASNMKCASAVVLGDDDVILTHASECSGCRLSFFHWNFSHLCAYSLNKTGGWNGVRKRRTSLANWHPVADNFSYGNFYAPLICGAEPILQLFLIRKHSWSRNNPALLRIALRRYGLSNL